MSRNYSFKSNKILCTNESSKLPSGILTTRLELSHRAKSVTWSMSEYPRKTILRITQNYFHNRSGAWTDEYAAGTYRQQRKHQLTHCDNGPRIGSVHAFRCKPPRVFILADYDCKSADELPQAFNPCVRSFEPSGASSSEA